MHKPQEIALSRRSAQRLSARDMEAVEFTVFDPETGEIRRSGTSQRCDLAGQAASAAEVVIEGAFPDDRFDIEVTEAGPRAIPRRPRAPSERMVRLETRRRILARYSIEDQINAAGTREADAMRAWVEAIRACGRKLRGMTPIPGDYTDDRHWRNSNG